MNRRHFRRRLPLRPRRRLPAPGSPFRRPPLPPRVRQALVRANQLLAEAQFVEAATIFERLSEQAERRGMLVRAGDLALQASRARYQAGDVATAVDRAKQGLRLLARGGRVERVPRVLSKMSAALREKGYDAQAEQLEQEVRGMLERLGTSFEEVSQHVPRTAERWGSLPARCSGCGASLVPDEVEWHDGRTAECLYCGMVVKTR